MKINIIYPPQSKQKLFWDELRNWLRWPLLAAAVVCPILNYYLGGKAWSAIVVWSIWIVWSLGLSRDLVEYNRISQTAKLIFDGAVLLTLIGTLLSPGWMETVLPLVCCGGLVVIGVLFFTDIDKQKQNMMPMLWLIIASILSFVLMISFWSKANNWEFALMGAAALALFGGCCRVIGRDLPRELKKRFHVK